MGDGSSPVLDTISADDFSECFKRLSENLSSSPSGRHIGHYKAVIGDEELYAHMLDSLVRVSRRGKENHFAIVSRQRRQQDRKSTRLNSSHSIASRMPSSA